MSKYKTDMIYPSLPQPTIYDQNGMPIEQNPYQPNQPPPQPNIFSQRVYPENNANFQNKQNIRPRSSKAKMCLIITGIVVAVVIIIIILGVIVAVLGKIYKTI